MHAAALLLVFLAGGLAAFLYFASRSPESETAEGLSFPESRADALAALLIPQAEWERQDRDLPMRWIGRLPATRSLIQWNADVTSGIRSLDLEVLEGREEVIPRPGRWPLQRLTLVVGGNGEVLGEVVIETTRSPSLPLVF
jgi:hypothetical protein